MPMNAWECLSCGNRMVIDHQFKPSRCSKCGATFKDGNTAQWESPFAEETDGGTNWEGPMEPV